MAAAARIGDIITGTCRAPVSGHPRTFTGTWVTASDTTTADGIGVVRVGDMGITDCGHHIIAIAGAERSTADGIVIHREGDPVIIQEGGEGVTITGSDNVDVE